MRLLYWQLKTLKKDAAKRRRRQEAKREHEEANDCGQALRSKKGEEVRRRKVEARVQATLRDMGLCVQGYQWV